MESKGCEKNKIKAKQAYLQQQIWPVKTLKQQQLIFDAAEEVEGMTLT